MYVWVGGGGGSKWRVIYFVEVYYISLQYKLWYMCVGGLSKVIRFVKFDYILIPKWYGLSIGNCALLLIHNDVNVMLSDDKFNYDLKTKVSEENMLLIYFQVLSQEIFFVCQS